MFLDQYEIFPITGASIRAIDLLCGIGRNSWGAQQAGVEIVAGFDIWELAGKVYQANFPKARFYNVDLSKPSNTDLLYIKKEVGKIDLILASPECTSHSNARGANPKNEKKFASFMEYMALCQGFSTTLDSD